MRRRYKKKKVKNNSPIFIMAILLIISLLSISVGFSALSTTLTVNGSARFEPVGMIRVTKIEEEANTNSTEINKSFTQDTVSTLVELNNLNSAITYKVKISNLGQVDKVLSEVIEEIFSNEQMEYSTSGLNIGDVIKAKEDAYINITYKYKNGINQIDSTRLNSKIKFVFDDYVNISSLAYFEEFNGLDGLFGFDKTNIISFERNSDLTLEEVLNKSGVKKISNEVEGDYKSTYDVYGYVENNKFYWWSEAPIVYFHPNTAKPFSKYTNLISVDLNGTSTEKVENFAHWFDTSRNIKTISGTIDTSGLKLEYNDNFNYRNDSNENSSSGKGLTYMFNDCNNLESVDLSKIDTTNSSDLKRMFGGCKKLKNIDVSHFNTKNAKSMYWMFRNNQSLEEIDLSNFDTSNVENMYGMFLSSNNIKTIILGEKFDTSKVKFMTNMFYNLSSLTTIYAKQDFIISSDNVSTNMFNGNNKLVGASGTTYETKFNSSYKNSTYAKLCTDSQKGYFTLSKDVTYYTVHFDPNGGNGSMDSQVFIHDQVSKLKKNTFTREGYKFIGWNTESDGTGTNYNNEEQVNNLTLENNITLYAIWEEKNQNSVLVFEVVGPCKFNGKDSNITGDNCSEYANTNYINTNINLYDEENYKSDFIIEFTVDEYNKANQDKNSTQNTIMNTKLEDSSKGYPGMVFRAYSSDPFELTQTINGSKVYHTFKTTTLSIRIIRKDSKIYYSVDNSAYKLLQDMSSFNAPFDVPVWFGASRNVSGDAFRHMNGTLSNMRIYLGKLDDSILEN